MSERTFTNRMGKVFNVENFGTRVRLSRPYDLGEGERIYTVEVDVVDLNTWASGTVSIQDAFPYLNADDREFLMSGLTPEEFEAMFGEYE